MGNNKIKKLKDEPRYDAIKQYEKEFKDSYQHTLGEMLGEMAINLKGIFNDTQQKTDSGIN